MDIETLEFEKFVENHERALLQSGLPEPLWQRLFDKIGAEEVYDGGSYFMLVPNEEKCVGGPYTLCAIDGIKLHQDVFLVDQCWISDGGFKASKQLTTLPLLQERLSDMFSCNVASFFEDTADKNKYEQQKKILKELYNVEEEAAESLLQNHSGCILDALLTVDSPELCKRQDNESQNKPSKAKCTFEEFKEALAQEVKNDVVDAYPDSYVKALYKSYLKDEDGSQIGSAVTQFYSWNDSAEDGFIYVDIPLSPNVKKSQVNSSLTSKSWTLKVGGKEILSGALSGQVNADESYWSFESPGHFCMALQKQGDGTPWSVLLKGELQLSFKEIMEKGWIDSSIKVAKTKRILDSMWAFNQTKPTYSTNKRVVIPLWYILDELGTGVMHSRTPNIKMSSFFYINKGLAYSIFWPIQDIEKGEPVSRNFFIHHSDDESIESMLLREEVYLGRKYNEKYSENTRQKVEDLNICGSVNPLVNFSFMAVDISKKVPKTVVFTNVGCPTFNMALEKFDNLEVTNDIEKADLILLAPGTTVANLSTVYRVNCLGEQHFYNLATLVKHVKKKLGKAAWLPEVYDLQSEFSKFYCEYQQGFGQLWVVKTAASHQMQFDPIITSYLLRIARMVETGPVVAAKYESNTMLHVGRKFTLSYAVVILGSCPFRIILHNHPLIRTAKSKYVPMNFYDEYDTSTMKCEMKNEVIGHQAPDAFQDFISSFDATCEKLRIKTKWSHCESQIKTCIAQFFQAALSDFGNKATGNIFGLFGIDFIITASQQPLMVDFDLFPSFANEKALHDILCLLRTDSNQDLISSHSFAEVVLDDQ